MIAMFSKTQRLGFLMECRAYRYLRRHGLIGLAKNFSYQTGEIDLIMSHDRTVVFVEVRYRQHSRLGCPVETVDRYKQQRLIKTARYYLTVHHLFEKVDARFDIVEVKPNKDIHWIQNVFDMEYA